MQLPLLQQVASRVAGAASKCRCGGRRPTTGPRPSSFAGEEARAVSPARARRYRGATGPAARIGLDRAAKDYCDCRAAGGVAVRAAGEAFPTSRTVLDAATANLK